MADDDTRDLDVVLLGEAGRDLAVPGENTLTAPDSPLHAGEAITLDLTEATAPPPPIATPPAGPDAQPRPRTRWAGVVWGLVFAALAAGGLRLAAGPHAIEEISAWVQQVEPATLIAYGLLAVGGLVLVTGLVGLARRAQKRLARPHG